MEIKFQYVAGKAFGFCQRNISKRYHYHSVKDMILFLVCALDKSITQAICYKAVQ